MHVTLIRDGEDQIVLLPDGTFPDGAELEIRREGDAVILQPVPLEDRDSAPTFPMA